MNLKKLSPEGVWRHFDSICAIPHPSKHEEKMRQYLIQFARENHLEFKTDQVGNIVILKPGSLGREKQKVLGMQAHIDMVPQKNADKIHDFTKDPIIPQIEGDWVKATGTTLGADNGIGVAVALAVLEDKNLSHGPLECLFTVDEEDGMTGAAELDSKMINCTALINLDSEQEGDIYVGCAGGVDGKFFLDYSLSAIPSDNISFKISITGLKGGHSGLDINLGRGNANKVLARIILETESLEKVKLQSFHGGSLRNAIPREAFGEMSFSHQLKSQVLATIQDSFNNIVKELGAIEPNLKLECIESHNPFYILEGELILNAVLACPHGVIAMSPDILDLVETSTNLAIVKTCHTQDKRGKVEIESFMRSSSDSALVALTRVHSALFDLAKFKIHFGNSYSGWKPNMNSFMLKLSSKIFKEMNGKEPSVKAIHAGLETGYFTKHFPGMDMISIGPTIKFPHSPDEKVSISSVAHFWDYLLLILKEYNF